MKGISEIQDKLANALENRESGSWSRLRNSLIGKELLAFGSEVIATSDNIVDTLVQSFDYSQADERALISLSRVHNLAVSFVKPAYIRLRLLDKIEASFKPFDLVYTVGNVKFTNISFFNGSDDIILYQGVVKSMYTEVITDYNYEKAVTWNRTVIPVGEDEIIVGHNIGKAVPDSVYVFYKDTGSRGIMSEYSPFCSGPELPVYKLFTLMNRDIMVLDGDGKWGKSNYIDPKYQILWLEPTSNTFSLNGKLNSFNYGNLAFQIVGNEQAKEDSLDYARDVFRRFYLKLNAIVSKDQIRQFVKSFSYVLDCNVTAKNNNVVVYIKPSDPNDTGEYGSIEAELDLKGGFLTNYEVLKGKALNFQFKLSEDLNAALKSQVEDYLMSICGYQNLGYTEVVDCSKISADLYSVFGINTKVSFIANRTSVESGNKFKFIPLEGTVKLIDAMGRETGYDLGGQLRAELRQEEYDVLKVPSHAKRSQLGRFIKSDDKFIWFDRGYIHKYPTNVILDRLNKITSDVRFITHNGYAYAYTVGGSSSNLIVFDVEQITPQGLNSVIIPITGSESKSMQRISDNTIPFYSNGGLYCLEKLSKELQLRFYSGVGSSAYFTLNIPVQSGTNVLGMYVDETKLFVVCNNNTVILISDFNTASVSWEVVKLDFSNTEISGEVIAFQCYKKGTCAALVKDNNNYHLVRFIGLNQSDSTVKFMNMTVLNSSSRLQKGCYEIQVTEDDVKLLWLRFPEVDTISTEVRVADTIQLVASSIEVYSNDGKVYTQSPDQGYPVYLYDESRSVVGFVNYLDGTVVYDASVSGTSFTYQSTKVILDEKTYLKLEETPVLWN